MIDYIVWDTETTTKNSCKRVANVFDNNNFVVMCGHRRSDSPEVFIDYTNKKLLDRDKHTCSLLLHLWKHNPKVLIGFNIKFDLLWIWGSKLFQDWLKAGGKIWDCAIAEYMLSGQDSQYPSLNFCALKYGGTIKDDRIKALWDAGADTTEIDEKMLREYNEQDVLNTEIVYLKQTAELAKDNDLLELVRIHNNYLLATTEMEFNGMNIDIKTAWSIKEALEAKVKQIEEDIRGYMPTTINLDSNDQLSAYLFGGDLKYIKKEEIGVFKTGARAGKPKFKNVEDKTTLPRRISPKPEWKTKKEGVFTVNEKVLSEIITLNKGKLVAKVLTLLLECRGYKKIISTYIDGFESVSIDGVIHQQLQHVSTETGRLSCKAPNVQNIPRVDKDKDGVDIKNVFNSRFDNGLIVEFDIDGAELVGAAILSNDSQFKKDLDNKELQAFGGLHSQSAAFALNKNIKDVTKEERQDAKTVNFGLLYGKSVFNLARDVFKGDMDTARAFSDSFYGRYPMLKRWQDNIVQTIQTKQYKPNPPRTTKEGHSINVCLYKSLLGRRFLFTQGKSPEYLREKGIEVSFNPPDIKNYPVQALATADIAGILFGTLFRLVIDKRDKYLLINTVHDSVIFDCVDKKYLTELMEDVNLSIEYLKSIFKDKFNIVLDVGINMTGKFGPSWGQLKDLNLNEVKKWQHKQ